MQIRTEDKDGVLICHIQGDIDIHSSPEFNKSVEKIAKDKSQKVVMEFSGVSYVDSSGLATLVAALKKLKSYGGKLKLANLSDKVKGLFEITRLDKLFDISDTEEEATRSFA
jgi:anti-sigma B factor antagonist